MGSIFAVQWYQLIFTSLSSVSSSSLIKRAFAKSECSEAPSQTSTLSRSSSQVVSITVASKLFEYLGKEALDFARHYQRRKFNQIEADLCEVFQLLGSTISSEKNGGSSSSSDEDEETQIDTTVKSKGSRIAAMRTHLTDQTKIKRKLKSPEALFQVENEQSNCPICLEGLHHQHSPLGSQTAIVSPMCPTGITTVTNLS